MSKIKFTEFSKFQRLNYVQIAPSGSLVALAGKNRQGKSSILDGLEAAICGHNGRVITRPINDGAEKAAITVETDDGLQVTRTYTPAGSKLVIKASDGAKYGQAKLDSLIGSLGIDASQFASLNDKDQLKTLLGLVDLPFDPAALDIERKAIFDERADVGRQGKAIGDVTVDKSLPTEETSASEIIAQIRQLEANSRARAEWANGVRLAEDTVSDLKEQIKALTANLANWESTLKTRLDGQADLPPAGDTAPLEAQLASVEDSNAAIRANNAALGKVARQAELRADYSTLSEQIDALDKRKADGLAKAKFPVDGLGFDAEGVLYKGRPFNRASSAEKVLVSAAMMIALNPELRVLIVRNGNDLDSESLATLESMAADADFQVFIEIVNETGDFGITIEDGEVAA